MGISAVVISANFVYTNMIRKEAGIYYQDAPTTLKLHAEEILASAGRCGQS